MSYVDEVLARVKAKNASEPEFLQAVEEVLESLRPVIRGHEEQYKKEALLERLTEPIVRSNFRVPWVDDKGPGTGEYRYRVQFKQCDWTVQGRTETSSVSKYRNYQIPWI